MEEARVNPVIYMFSMEEREKIVQSDPEVQKALKYLKKKGQHDPFMARIVQQHLRMLTQKKRAEYDASAPVAEHDIIKDIIEEEEKDHESEFVR